jgi:hypothetical protein
MHRSIRVSVAKSICFILTGLTAIGFSTAAPVITSVENGSPVHAQAGEPILLFAEGLEAPVRVYFSDGTDPVLESADVEADLDRGIVVARVPVGALTGDMKISANGVDSALYYFHVDTGAFNQGTRSVSGQVTDGVDPVAGAAVVLMQFDGCDHETFWDFALTDASGNYALNGIDGDYGLFVFPPTSTNLIVGGAEITLEATPLIQNFTLFSGTQVTGRIVPSALPSVGVPNARVDFETETGAFDTILTDADGYYTVQLAPGDYEQWVVPGAGALLAYSERQVTIGITSPQDIGDLALAGGVEISGFVRRQSDLTPLPNVEIGVHPVDSCCDPTDEAIAGGDGSFSLVVPPNQNYNLQVWVDDDQPYADLQVNDLFVGNSGLAQNLDLEDAAFISGRLTDADTGSPLFDFGVEASPVPWDGMSIAWTWTCEDGTYRLRVPPSGQGYVVGSNRWEETGYTPVTWNNTPEGTFFPCQGTSVPALTAGSETANINLPLPPGAGAISGSAFTQDSGCTVLVSGQQWMQVDDGIDAGCSLGVQDYMAADGTFRVFGLPHSGLVSSLRVCNYSVWDASPQCFSMMLPPDYTPIVVPYGSEVTNVDFCMGNRPDKEVHGLQADKSGDLVFFSWDDSDDPYHDRYRLRGAVSVEPAVAGSFPDDPAFDMMFEDYSTSATVSTFSSYTYFLVTDVGVTGVEGPSGSYGK